MFPNLPAAARASAMALPDPHAGARSEGHRPRPEPSWQDWLSREINRAVRKVLRDLMRSIF